ncbi:NAD(P)/FAD-dependent oxidoreductase [Patescibacteria group bacterium]
MQDLIIIGGGPAGITAGIYASRQNIKTLLITKSFGGQMARKTVDIENYPGFEKISGTEIISRFEKQLRGQNIEILIDEVGSLKKKGDEFFVSTKGKKQFNSKTVIVATGADPRPLEVKGEKEFIGRGVSYCTLCDGPVFAGKNVAVIGGGNSALEAAIFISGYAKKVYILERGSHAKGDKIIHDKVLKMENIEIIVNVGLKEIRGKKLVDSLIYEDTKTKEEKILEIEGIFVEIGLQPATSFLKGQVNFNKKDEIIVDLKTSQTNVSGLFTAGDVDDIPYKQIIIAAGEGAKAALSVYNYLKK